jgi:hypothetical protein
MSASFATEIQSTSHRKKTTPCVSPSFVFDNDESNLGNSYSSFPLGLVEPVDEDIRAWKRLERRRHQLLQTVAVVFLDMAELVQIKGRLEMRVLLLPQECDIVPALAPVLLRLIGRSTVTLNSTIRLYLRAWSCIRSSFALRKIC